MGWILERHAVLYGEEYGFDGRFEAQVAKVVTSFLESFDPQRERAWIAEHEGERVGSVALVEREPQVAQLRLLLLEPQARGLGLGPRLVGVCTEFARSCGYERIVLETTSQLIAARKLYAREGYRLLESWPTDEFGPALDFEIWRLDL